MKKKGILFGSSIIVLLLILVFFYHHHNTSAMQNKQEISTTRNNNDKNKKKEITTTSQITKSDKNYANYHIDLEEQLNYFSNTSSYDIDFNKNYLHLMVCPANHPTEIVNKYDREKEIWKEVCITQGNKYGVYLNCGILKMDKSHLASPDETSSFYSKDDVKKIEIKELYNYEILYNNFVSIYSDEKLPSSLTQSTYVFDSIFKIKEFEKNYNLDLIQSKYLSIEHSPLDLDFNRYNLIFCINTERSNIRTYGYPVKKLFIKDDEIKPIYDYNNKTTIINETTSPYPAKSNQVYLTLIKVDKSDVPQNCINKY
jgi:frataxin-like iron-binding protein CyaY